MSAEVIAIFNHLMWILLIIVGILFASAGTDELIFDAVYWGNFFYKKLKGKTGSGFSHEEVMALPEKKIAIIVPCWHEQAVIEDMLRHNLANITYKNYAFFVGVHPNDVETIAAIERVASTNSNVHCVVNDHPGPTRKADNLNYLYHYILSHESAMETPYDIFLMHDAEDVIHPAALHLCNYGMLQNDMVQIPIFPLKVSWHCFTHWVYNDEFAELHTKDIVVRELIHGFIPSAGVGTAFSRKALQILADTNEGNPFSLESLVEDYNVALRLQVLNLKASFLSHKLPHVEYRKKWIIGGKLVPKMVHSHVATRALFPMHYADAVRQRARWTLGIVFQEWEESGWPGKTAVLYTLAHDRQAIFSHFISGLGYIVGLYWLINYFTDFLGPSVLPDLLDSHPGVDLLIYYCTFLMCERLLQRMIATTRIYGIGAGLLSIPRVIYGNIINFHHSMTALKTFIVHKWTRKKGTWAKTNNVFPHKKYLHHTGKRLGDLLVEKKLVTVAQMQEVMRQHVKTHESLARLFLKSGFVTLEQLNEMIAEEYRIEVVEYSTSQIVSRKQLPEIKSKYYMWLLHHNLFPIHLTDRTVTIVLNDPSDEHLKQEAMKKLEPYHTKFVFAAKASDAMKRETQTEEVL